MSLTDELIEFNSFGTPGRGRRDDDDEGWGGDHDDIHYGGCARADSRPQHLVMHTSCMYKETEILSKFKRRKKVLHTTLHDRIAFRRRCLPLDQYGPLVGGGQ